MNKFKKFQKVAITRQEAKNITGGGITCMGASGEIFVPGDSPEAHAFFIDLFNRAGAGIYYCDYPQQ